MVTAVSVGFSISYYDLGLKTAELAAKILKGTAVKDVPVFFNTADTCSYTFSKKNLEDAGFKTEDLPSEFPWKEAK